MEVLGRKRGEVEGEEEGWRMETEWSALQERWTRSLGRSLISALLEALGYLAEGRKTSEVAVEDGEEMEEGDRREAAVSRPINVWEWSSEEETRGH